MITGAETLISEVLRLEYFQPTPSGVTPIPTYWKPGTGSTVVVVGENASGKSFLRRVIAYLCQQSNLECIHTSMQERVQSTGLKRIMVYGEETESATGYNSANLILGSMRTCQSRENPHVMVWDEPELGLSDNSAAGVGVALRDFLRVPPAHTLAQVIITHSRALAQQLLDLDPHYLHLGSESPPKSLLEWMRAPITPRSISDILLAGKGRYRLVEDVRKVRRGQ